MSSGPRTQMTMRLHVLLGLVLLTGWARPSGARSATFADGLPDRVTPGQEVVLRWADLPRTVDEIEILLSLDGGRTFPVRVSRELDPNENELRWRVPHVETGEAVLRLRMGTDDREIDGPSSHVFRISGSIGDSLRGDPDELVFHEGYLWTGLEPIHDPLQSGLTPPEARIEAQDCSPSNAPRDHGMLAIPSARAVSRVIVQDRASKASVRDLPAQAPRLDPLRI